MLGGAPKPTKNGMPRSLSDDVNTSDLEEFIVDEDHEDPEMLLEKKRAQILDPLISNLTQKKSRLLRELKEVTQEVEDARNYKNGIQRNGRDITHLVALVQPQIRKYIEDNPHIFE